LVKTFVTEGLDPTSLSADNVAAAIDAGKLVTWERRNRTKFFDPAFLSDPRAAVRPLGIRLIAPLAPYLRAGRAATEIRRILEYPGYEVSIRNPSDKSALASFVFDNSLKRRRLGQVLSWPLKVTGAKDVLKILEKSRAVRLGLAELVALDRTGAMPSDTPYVFVDMVRFDDPSFRGDALGLRFLQYGRSASPLPDHLNLDDLREIEPAVFLRPGHSTPDQRFTNFVVELSRNRTVDVAAWQSARDLYTGTDESPLVVASPDFLRGARVSETLPALRSRLRDLGDTIVPIARKDINRLGVKNLKPHQHGAPASLLASLLDDPTMELAWHRASNAGEGIVAVHKGVEALAQRVDTGAEAADVVPPPRPPRFTDIRIFDAKGKALPLRPLLKKDERYTLDVAIRSDRIGLSRKRTDQGPIQIPAHPETITLWVVVSDETDGDDEVDGKLFTFDHRIAELKLPVLGNSLGSGRFPFAAHFHLYYRSRSGRRVIQPRLGIRVYHKLNLIDHIQLDLRFGAATKANKAGIKLVFKHVAPERGIETPNPTAAARAVTISISRPADNSDCYTMAFVAGNTAGTGAPHLSGVKKMPETVLNSWVSEFRSILLDTVFGPSFGQITLPPVERQDLIDTLSRLGTKIASGLFDYGKMPASDFYKLGTMLKEALPETSIVQISLSRGAQDFVFPWQILALADYIDGDPHADPKNLWGYRFIIEVKRCGDGADRRPTAAHPIPARINYARWNFQNEPQHFAKLQALVAATNNAVQLQQPVVETRDDMLAALKSGGGELFYVYAHGYSAPPTNPSVVHLRKSTAERLEALSARISANTGNLYSTQQLEAWKDIYQQFRKAMTIGADSSLTLANTDVPLTFLLTRLQGGTHPLVDAPIVFLNTCDSAQVWNAMEDSFVSVFLNNGARAVLGTESTIPVVLADEFGQAVLKSIIDGSSLGQAVLDGRKMLLDAYQNPLGLCYCIYGDADARLLRSTPLARNQDGP